MKEQYKLRPCPWCGVLPRLIKNHSGIFFSYCCESPLLPSVGQISCQIQPSTNWKTSPEEVLEIWNKRPLEDALAKALEGILGDNNCCCSYGIGHPLMKNHSQVCCIAQKALKKWKVNS